MTPPPQTMAALSTKTTKTTMMMNLLETTECLIFLATVSEMPGGSWKVRATAEATVELAPSADSEADCDGRVEMTTPEC